jgi:hypothetical protein
MCVLVLTGCTSDPNVMYKAQCEQDGKVIFDTGTLKGFENIPLQTAPYITNEGVLFYSGGAYKIPPGASCKMWKITPKPT